MVGVQSVVEGMVQTFGPFLIPVTVFAIGLVGYTVLYLVSRQLRPDEDEGVVNLSAGTPERSATDKDHGASTRGVVPRDEEGGRHEPEADGGGTSVSGSGDGDGSRDGETDDRPEDAPRRND
ncbi:hypothetical protein [Haloglomus litoreum]|uniref:hypothetical protein n=1 Tax=Haloglomus litoreum TaxID=3034026 RepID=UPI0023E7E68A|nr:hypothetical protein [Haloglomus sp. DT116]